MTNSTQTTPARLDWRALLIEQFQWHWEQQARPRLVGLSDQEYFWEPVHPAWNVRRRNAAHFNGPAIDYPSFPYAGTADEALMQLDDGVGRWLHGVEILGPDDLSQPCGEAEGAFAAVPIATLVLHIHRELIHYAAEIALLRDLWAHRE
ncbi:MAG: DinB family protein [Ornithinimicrobium sp.]